jgi:hypothetical protein
VAWYSRDGAGAPGEPPQAPPRCAVLLARILDADCTRDEHGRKVLDTSGVEGQIEDLSAYAAEIRWGVGPPSAHHVRVLHGDRDHAGRDAAVPPEASEVLEALPSLTALGHSPGQLVTFGLPG